MKILGLEKLAQKINALKSEGKKIVHCHGCFDLMHPGHIKYFQAAKRMGDILIVTVTPDVYVDKCPGRPVFKETLRAESIAALECVDYVAINKWQTAEETLKLLRPHIYVKGQEFENLEDKTGKIQKEYRVIQEIGAEIRFTHEIVFSSTKLINQYFNKSDWTQINADNQDFKYKGLTEKIIKLFYMVYNKLGYGFLERVYGNGMILELRKEGISVISQFPIKVRYDNEIIGEYFADMLIDNKIIIEIKASKNLLEEHEAQLLNYLKATDIEVGLLLNFGPEPEIRRKAFNNIRK